MRRSVSKFARQSCAMAALLALGSTAHAGIFDDDEARKRVEDVRQRLTETTRQIDTLNRNQLDFSNQQESLKAELARLRGQIEVLSYEMEATQKRQKDFYVDLDNRLRKLETAAAPKADTPPKADPQAEANEYEAAVSALKGAQFKPAADGFLAFIKKYPHSTLLASAHYWGGYAHAQLKDHAKAVDLFATFAATWPNDERTPVALESEITSLEALKDTKAARTRLELLADKYPASEAGRRAKLRLKKK